MKSRLMIVAIISLINLNLAFGADSTSSPQADSNIPSPPTIQQSPPQAGPPDFPGPAGQAEPNRQGPPMGFFPFGGPRVEPNYPSAVDTESVIRINSLGFLPAAQKKATIISKCSNFRVKEVLKGRTAYSGKVTGPFSQQDVNQTVWIADFSNVNKPGKYYLEVPGVGKSYEFEIGDKVYDEALRVSMRAFYLWRCGTAVEGDHNGKHFAHAACHTDDAWLDYIGEPNTKRDGTAGWHDAGDFNKYIVNAGVTVGALVWAWEHYQDKLKDFDLNIPDTAPGYPDWLKEIKWEYDWLL